MKTIRRLAGLIFLACLPALAQQCPQGYTLTSGKCVVSSVATYHYTDIQLGAVQNMTFGCLLLNSFTTAGQPDCFSMLGSPTQHQTGLPQFSAAGKAIHFRFVLPEDFVSNTPLIFTWVWLDTADTSSTVTWDISKYACVAVSGVDAQPTMLNGVTAAATANAGTVNQTAKVSATLTPSGSGVGNCVGGSLFQAITTLNARSGSNSPVLTTLTAKYYRLLAH